MFTPLKSFADSVTDHDSPFSIDSYTLFQLNIYKVFFFQFQLCICSTILTSNKIMIRADPIHIQSGHLRDLNPFSQIKEKFIYYYQTINDFWSIFASPNKKLHVYPLKSFTDSVTDHDSPFSINSHTLFQLNIYEVFFLVSIMSLLNSLTHNKIMIRDGSGAYPKWTFKGI